MKSIIDAKDLNKRLHTLYKKRELIAFMYSMECFDKQVLAIWEEWLKYEMYPAQPGSIQEMLKTLDTPEFHKGCWEIDYGYEYCPELADVV